MNPKMVLACLSVTRCQLSLSSLPDIAGVLRMSSRECY
jgi:hypothetical protein